MNPKTEARLAAAAAKITGKELQGTGPKTEFLQFRVSKIEKQSIQDTAESLGLQVSEYLLKIHERVAAQLKSK